MSDSDPTQGPPAPAEPVGYEPGAPGTPPPGVVVDEDGYVVEGEVEQDVEQEDDSDDA